MNVADNAGRLDAVTVRDLSVAYKPGKYIIKNMSFSVKRGSTVVITGKSGCGKSTLCSALCGLMPSVIKAEISGSVTYSAYVGIPIGISSRTSIGISGGASDAVPAGGSGGASDDDFINIDISTANEAERTGLVGMVFQNPDDQLICSTVEDEIAFGLENLCIPYENMRQRVDEQLKYFNIEHLALRDPSRLSGGQKKIVTIAAVLAMRPEVLILDEPMTGLDEPAREMVREAIFKLKNDGRTLIVVEHWTDTVDYADEFIDMQKINNIQEM